MFTEILSHTFAFMKSFTVTGRRNNGTMIWLNKARPVKTSAITRDLPSTTEYKPNVTKATNITDA